MTLARDSHGTLVSVQATPGGAWTEIAELGDLILPEEMRNEFDASKQNSTIDAYVLSALMRRGPFPMPIHYLPGNASHIALYTLYRANTVTGWKVQVPAISGGDAGTIFIASGQVQHIAPKAPNEGLLAADVTIRFSGAMLVDGVAVGT